MQIVDHSSEDGIEVSIFDPRRECLPEITDNNTVAIIRTIKVSTDSSSKVKCL